MFLSVFPTSNTFNYISSITNQVWKFQRYFLVVEYESKPFLPPPLVIVSHLILLFKCIKQRVQGSQDVFDHSPSEFLVYFTLYQATVPAHPTHQGFH